MICVVLSGNGIIPDGGMRLLGSVKRLPYRVRPKIPRQNHSERAARNIRAARAGG